MVVTASWGLDAPTRQWVADHAEVARLKNTLMQQAAEIEQLRAQLRFYQARAFTGTSVSTGSLGMTTSTLTISDATSSTSSFYELPTYAPSRCASKRAVSEREIAITAGWEKPKRQPDFFDPIHRHYTYRCQLREGHDGPCDYGI